MGLELGIVPARDGPSPALRCQPAASRVGSAGGASGERAKGPPPWFGDGPSWVACMKVPSGSARPVAGSVCCRGVVGGCYSRASKWLQKSSLATGWPHRPHHGCACLGSVCRHAWHVPVVAWGAT